MFDINAAGDRYENPLQELIGYLETPDHETTGDYLLVFRDAKGLQLTLRLQGSAIDSLVLKLEAGPHPTHAVTPSAA